MASPIIKIKRSSVQGKQPGVADLPLGELALNTYDGRLYVSKSTDSGVTTSIVNVSGIQIQDEGTSVGYANTINFVGSGVTVLSITNGVGIVSVSSGGGGGGASVSISTVAPSTPTAGDLWYNNNLGRTFIYYDEVAAGIGLTAVWVDAAPFNIPEPDSTPGKSSTTFTATEGQTSFTVSYSVGYIDVFLNGIRLNSSEYIANSGTSLTLFEAASAGDIIDVVEYRMGIGATGATGATGSSAKNVYSYTATASQTSFNASYSIGYVDVYLNGIKLTESEYTATDGSTVVLNEGASIDDIVEITGYQTYSVGAYAISAGIATFATYATTAGIATYATTSGVSTTATTAGYATTAGIATIAQGLTGTPNIQVGIVTATSFSGSGANLTGIVTSIIAGVGISVNQNTITTSNLYYRLNSDLVGLNTTAAQNILGVGASLSANTVYSFEGFSIFTRSAGATSHNFRLGFGGTATINNMSVEYHASVYTGSIPDYASNTYVGVQTGTSVVTAVPTIAGSPRVITVYTKGTVSTSAAGTFTPQYVLSAAPGGAYTVKAGAYFEFNPLGSAGSDVSVGNWS